MSKGFAKSPTNRQLRVGELLKQKLSEEFLKNNFFDEKISDFRLTITEVKMTPDLRKARVFVVPLKEENSKNIFSALNQIARKIQGKIGRSLGLRFTPEIIFEEDLTLDNFSKIEKLLLNINKNNKK